jgi:hypothetical protein
MALPKKKKKHEKNRHEYGHEQENRESKSMTRCPMYEMAASHPEKLWVGSVFEFLRIQDTSRLSIYFTSFENQGKSANAKLNK